MSEALKIIELRAENFKRLVAVHIRPDGQLVQITGRNAQGKSSVLDAIWAALGGAAAAPSKPIRKGATTAVVVLDLGDVKVTRKWTADDRSTLTVESAQGLRHPSPQAVLDKLVGKLSFDPLSFSRMDPKQQAATLRQLVGLDLAELTREHDRVFAKRTEIGRQGKAIEGQIAGMPEPPAGMPDEETSIAALVEQQRAAMAQRAENDKIRRTAEHALERVAEAKRQASRKQAAVEQAQKALDQAQKDLEAARQGVAEEEAACGRLVDTAAELTDPDVDTITAEMKAADTRNAAVRAKKARAAKLVEQQVKREEWAQLTEQIKELEQRKAAMLRDAKFPIEGLSVDGEIVTFGGLPLAQASSAEQLRVGLAMGAALNPKLRVVLVRDGSLLDAEGLRLVAEWAGRERMQVIMERVADGTGCGVVIEDGQVVGAEVVVEAPSDAAAVVS